MKLKPCYLRATLVLLGLLSTTSGACAEPVKIAFLPDIHFHDVYGSFEDANFSGQEVMTAEGKAIATARSMRAQLNSTRLFNENYFALLAALDDIVERDIKLVALPGDFSDNGQPINITGLNQILDRYTKEYGLRFFAAPGNHDPNRPFTRPAGIADYLDEQGIEQAVYSPSYKACNEAQPPASSEQNVICSREIVEWGYKELMNALSEKGFYPHPDDLYFSTPFSTTTPENYSYKSAVSESGFAQRQYEICSVNGEANNANLKKCFSVPDASYLVEPVKGLWLLSIDANVYIPKTDADKNPNNPDNFYGSGNAGYNKVLSDKKHLLKWITDIVQQADQQGKTLVAFSHFPMTEFYDGASKEIASFWGSNNFQLQRKPTAETVQALAATGLKIHVGGHMHFNDTALYQNNEHTLLNIQAPTLAGYIPAYKLLHVTESDIEVETIVIDEVPRFKELFPLYESEWEYLNSINSPEIWNKAILQSKDYHEFTDWHLSELIRLRFLPKEWPETMNNELLSMNGLTLLKTPTKNNYESVIEKNALSIESLQQWNGYDLIKDFYRLRNADQLATLDISPQRLHEYKVISATFQKSGASSLSNTFGTIFSVLEQFSNSTPSDHFSFDLNNGQITDLVKAPRTKTAKALTVADIQTIGTHNSYKMAIPEHELAVIEIVDEKEAIMLDYAHIPITEQLDMGMRQLEIDVYYDPEGNRYSNPLLPRLMSWFGYPEFKKEGFQQPGFKVMHVQDVDQRSHCNPLSQCLTEIKTWSNANPDHVPILILINAKQDGPDIPFETKSLPFDELAFSQLDKEILNTIPAEKIITPDDVRGNFNSLREAITNEGWPVLSQARGKLLFALDEKPEVVKTYMRGNSSLQGLPIFINTFDETADHAAYFTRNEPKRDQQEIQRLVQQGFIIRTRADAGTIEARNNDVSRRQAALSSGAQYISTDYNHAREDFSDYSVALPGGEVARCNPVRLHEPCKATNINHQTHSHP